MIVHLTLRLLAIAPVILVLGCGRKEMTRGDLKSDLKQSISLASEAETFVTYIGQGRSTSDFAFGHLDYLSDEVKRNAQELSKANASPDLINVLNVDRVQLNLLAAQIGNVKRHLQEAITLAGSEEQIRKTRVALIQASSSL
jgi:hypothetical protein